MDLAEDSLFVVLSLYEFLICHIDSGFPFLLLQFLHFLKVASIMLIERDVLGSDSMRRVSMTILDHEEVSDNNVVLVRHYNYVTVPTLLIAILIDYLYNTDNIVVL